MAEGRAPIKVGTGYIEIIPKVLAKDMADLRRKVSSEMGKLGRAAAKDISQGAKKGLSSLPADVQKQAKKAKSAVEKEAIDTAKTLKKIEKGITREFGAEAAARFREYRKLEERRQRLLSQTSAQTRTAVRDVVRQEERAARERGAIAERLERERRQLQEQARREHDRQERAKAAEAERAARQALQAQKAALRELVAAQREATREQVAALRGQAAAQRAVLQDGIAAQQARMVHLRDQVRDINRDINATNRTTQSYFDRAGTGIRRMGTWFDQVGTSIREAGNILTHSFLAPLAAAGAALTAIGVENADKRLLGQLGLSSAGVSKSVSAAQMAAIQKYAIDTPFSIDVMHEYQMKLIRSVAGADKAWFSKDAKKRTGAANKAAGRTTDLIMAIGDSMARAGNLNPDQFKRAMYAMDMIMDMDRAPTKNVKQLAAASGMPASELAQLLGFENASKMWKVVGTPAKDGGGVTGTQIMEAMLNYWNPEKYKGSQKSDGSIGFASKMTSETITGRIQQMKERASFELGNLFIQEGEDGTYQYTDLGNKIAGQGGILDQVQDLAKKYGPKVDDFLSLFLDGVETFISTIDTAATWIEESGLGDLARPVAEFLLKWGPLILAVGLLSKVLGKAVGLVGRAFSPIAALTRGAVRGYEGQRDYRDQRRAARDARRDTRASGGTRREARRAGREAYRQQRTTNRNGDDRTPVRRLLDGVAGRDSRERDGQRQLRELEAQIREARDEAAELRGELREVNRESMRQITAALAGNGNGNLQGAANQAQHALSRAAQRAQGLNQTRLNSVDQALANVRAEAEKLTKALGNAGKGVTALDGRKLGSLRAQQVETTTRRVNELRMGTDKAASAVGGLNRSPLGKLRNEVKATTTAADGSTKAVKGTSNAVNTLKEKSLRALRDWIDRLTSSASEAAKKVGTRSSTASLNGRVKSLADQSLRSLNKAVQDLSKNLDKAKREAQGLDSSLGSISRRTPGSSSGNGKSKKKARGGVMSHADVSFAGVLPGYAPWKDSIPAVLSPGEAVLRPEVTNALGADTINAWNAEAIRGRISRHARGTAGGGMGLGQVKDLVDLLDIAPIGTAMLKAMKLDGSSDRLGGPAQGGVLRTGDHSAGIGGSAGAAKFKGAYDWMTEDMFHVLKRVPSGVGQIAGILGGALGPTLGEHFWDDVWKGSGNIVERGNRYLGHVFSLDTLGAVWDGLYSGVGDSLGAIWDTVTNPVDTLTTAFKDLGDIFSGSLNNIVGMVGTVREIRDSPLGYARRVYDGFMDDARDAMPNTEGLMDFRSGAKVSVKVPDLGQAMVSPGKGKGAQRWAPVAAQALGLLGLPSSALDTVVHRIGVESGGDPNIVNKWDSNWIAGHPSVGLMQVIGPTYQAYAGRFRNVGPFKYGTSVNPLANIYAGLNYARNRYGSRWQSVLSGTTGYARGTLSASPGLALVGEEGPELVRFRGGERVYPAGETEAMLNGRRYEIHVHEARNEPTPQAVMRALQTAEALYTTL